MGFGEYEFPPPYVWTLDSFIGYLISTSLVSKAAMGEAAEEFESDLRRRLLTYDARGQYPETMDFHSILARRPSLEAEWT